MKKKLFFICWVLSIMLVAQNLQAQVTIGNASPPHDFSTLEISSDHLGGLRLPRMSTIDRDTKLMTMPGFVAEKGADGLATGLTIYNTDTRCIEYWDSNKWVSLCLGTANITLSNTCGSAVTVNEPAAMAAADGTSLECVYTPADNPPCVVPQGQAYQVYLTAGSSYASVSVDNLTSAFSIDFEPNNTSNVRSAVVRVVNNCSGEFQDFVFQQAGAQCSGVSNPVLNINSASLCGLGRVFAYVTNPVAGVNYVWAYGNTIVHTGTYLEADRAGVYRVYAGLLGCGTPATLSISSLAGSNAQPAPIVNVTNSGILCSSGSVVLTASNTNQNPVQWYHNGVPYGTASANPITVSGASMAGEWFASVVNGGCYSASSNKVILSSQSTGTSLKTPIATVNGQDLTNANLVLCQGGSLSLVVTNSSDYNPGTTFEWFVNGKSIGVSTKLSTVYSLPTNLNNIILSVQANYSGGDCPATAISKSTNVNFSAPSNTSINNGAADAFICGTTPALLVASYSAGAAYEWYLNGELVATTLSGVSSYSTTSKGIYTVRYKDANACWSRLSAGINVGASNAIDAEWAIAPKDQEIVGSTRNYSVITAPAASQYIWSAPGAVSVTPFDNGSSAAIKFPENATNITVSVQAINGCGTLTLSKPVQVITGCAPVGAVNILPNGATLEAGQSLTFTATAANAQTYKWQLNGTTVGTGSSYSYTAKSASSTPDKLTVIASRTTDCQSSESANADITVNPKLADIVTDNSGLYNISGQTCFDVNMTSTTPCGSISNRINSFDPNLSFNYTFSSTSSTPSVAFYTNDPDVLIQSVVQNGKVYTITFRQDIRQFIANNGAKALQVIAVFTNASSQQRKLQLTLNIKDCACCGAFASNGVWKNFMCHNLGADYNSDPFTPSQSNNGNYYRWGSITAAATLSSPDGTNTGWQSLPYGSTGTEWTDNVKGPKDPCPTGYRVPTSAEWTAVINNNTITSTGTWTTTSVSAFTAGLKIGEKLMLPISGYRNNNSGGLLGRGNNVYYWSSTPANATTVNRLWIYANGLAREINAVLPTWGHVVRCVAE